MPCARHSADLRQEQKAAGRSAASGSTLGANRSRSSSIHHQRVLHEAHTIDLRPAGESRNAFLRHILHVAAAESMCVLAHQFS